MIYNPEMKSAYMFVPGIMGLGIDADMHHDDIGVDRAGKRARYDGGTTGITVETGNDGLRENSPFTWRSPWSTLHIHLIVELLRARGSHYRAV